MENEKEKLYGPDGVEVLELIQKSRPQFWNASEKDRDLLGDAVYEARAAIYENIAHYFFLKKFGSEEAVVDGTKRTSQAYNPDLFIQK